MTGFIPTVYIQSDYQEIEPAIESLAHISLKFNFMHCIIFLLFFTTADVVSLELW